MSNTLSIGQTDEPRPLASVGYGLAILETLVQYLEQNMNGLSSHEVALAIAQAQKAGAVIEDAAQKAGMLEEHEILGAAGWLGLLRH